MRQGSFGGAVPRAGAGRVAFTANSTESLNMAIRAWCARGPGWRLPRWSTTACCVPCQMEAEGAVLEIAGRVEEELPPGIPCAERASGLPGA